MEQELLIQRRNNRGQTQHYHVTLMTSEVLVHVAKLYISDEGLKRKLVRRQLNLKYWEKFSKILRSSHYRCSIRKGVLKNFSKFTRKYHTCNTCVKDSFNTLQASPGECFLLLANKYFVIKIG